MRGPAANGRARRPTHGLRRLAVCVRHHGVRSPARRPAPSGGAQRARDNPRMEQRPQRFDIDRDRTAHRIRDLRYSASPRIGA